MKFNIIKNILMGTALLAIGLMSSCKDYDYETESGYDRLFRTTEIGTSIALDSVTIYWKKIPNVSRYKVVISEDSMAANYTPVVEEYVTGDTLKLFKNPSIKRETYYTVRIISQTDGTNESKEAVLAFQTKSEQRLSTVSYISENSVRINWGKTDIAPDGTETTIAVDKLVLSSAGAQDVEITLPQDSIIAGHYTIRSLSSKTKYNVKLWNGIMKRGEKDFETLRSFEGYTEYIFDDSNTKLTGLLSGATGRVLVTIPAGLAAAPEIDKVPEGVTDLVVRGQGGIDTTPVAFFKGMNLVAENQTVNSILIYNLNITSASGSYIWNQNLPGKIGSLSIDRCTLIDTTRGIFRFQGEADSEGSVVDKISVNNCVFKNIIDYGLINANKMSKMIIGDVSVSKTTFNTFCDNKKAASFILVSCKSNSYTIDRCTFYNMAIVDGKAIFDFNTGEKDADNKTIYQVPGGEIKVTNSIFAKTVPVKGDNGGKNCYAIAPNTISATVSNTYITSDFIFESGYELGGISYASPASKLFKDPANGVFTFKDSSFAGAKNAGDPRWYAK